MPFFPVNGRATLGRLGRQSRCPCTLERVKPMHLPEVESFDSNHPRGEAIRRMRAAGVPVPQIFHLFAYKPDRTDALAEFTQGVMRGPSPLSPGERELIAAFTSRRNQCLF
jgi:alkylhydroperoxidase family enzyme